MPRPTIERLASALRSATDAAGVTQEQVASELGVHQTTVSKWLVGKTWPPFDALPVIDALCRQPVGTVLRLAGYVEEVDVAGAIQADPRLNPNGRKVVLAFYEFEVSRNRSASDDTNPDADDIATRKSVIR